MALPNEVTQIPDPMTIYQQGEKKTADLQAKQTAAEADIKARQAAETAPIQQARDTAGTDLGKMLDKGPDQVALPKNEATHLDPKQLSESAGMMMALAGLAGAMIRAPITVALRGMTGAMQGAQAADEKQFNEGYTKYKDNLNEALKLNDEKLKEYDRVLKGKEFNVREMDAQLRNIAKKYGDEGIANAKDFKTMFDSVNGQTKAMADIRKHQDTIDQHVKDRQQRAELAKEKASKGAVGSGAGGEAPKTTEEMYATASHFGMTKEAFEKAVDQFNTNGVLPSNTRSQKNMPLIIAIQNRAAEKYPDSNLSENKMQSKAYSTAYTQTINREAAVNRTINAVKENQPKITALVDKLNRSLGGEFANSTMNSLAEKFGDNKDLQELRNLIYAASREYVIATTMPGSNAQMHAAHAEDANKMLNMNMPPSKLAGALQGMNEDMAASENGLAMEASRLEDLVRGINKPVGGGGAKSREFKSEADAAAAGLAPGTKITIGGVSGTWH